MYFSSDTSEGLDGFVAVEGGAGVAGLEQFRSPVRQQASNTWNKIIFGAVLRIDFISDLSFLVLQIRFWSGPGA